MSLELKHLPDKAKGAEMVTYNLAFGCPSVHSTHPPAFLATSKQTVLPKHFGHLVPIPSKQRDRPTKDDLFVLFELSHLFRNFNVIDVH